MLHSHSKNLLKDFSPHTGLAARIPWFPFRCKWSRVMVASLSWFCWAVRTPKRPAGTAGLLVRGLLETDLEPSDLQDDCALHITTVECQRVHKCWGGVRTGCANCNLAASDWQCLVRSPSFFSTRRGAGTSQSLGGQEGAHLLLAKNAVGDLISNWIKFAFFQAKCLRYMIRIASQDLCEFRSRVI